MPKETLLDEVNKLYLTFTCPIIQIFESLSASFQASSPDPSKLFQDLEELRNFLLKIFYKDFRQRKLAWLSSNGKLGGKLEHGFICSKISSD